MSAASRGPAEYSVTSTKKRRGLSEPAEAVERVERAYRDIIDEIRKLGS